MPLSFAVTWDYRCPFARNAHEHVLTGLAAGAEWDVTFLPFSLSQAHVSEGETDVWDEPAKDRGLIALQAGVIVNQQHPEAFAEVHRALFAARHDEGLHLEDESVVRGVLERAGVDADAVLAQIHDGTVLKTVRELHESAVDEHQVWGVPTFIATAPDAGSQSVFVRLMNRAQPGSDPAVSIRAIERVVDLITTWPELNEFKHTSIPR